MIIRLINHKVQEAIRHSAIGPSSLLLDCEIFANLRITFVSSSGILTEAGLAAVTR